MRPRLRDSDADALQFHFDAERLPLLSLQRLDWWLHNEAERSGGINSLGSVLYCAPNLKYLSVGGVGFNRVHMESEMLCLPELQTLRLHVRSGLLLLQIGKFWALPALTCVILESPMNPEILHGMWETIGPQLRVVEFGKHLRFMLFDIFGPCLQACPNLTQVNYYVFFAAPPNIHYPHSSVHTIGLHASVNQLLQDEEEVCGHVELHLRALTDSLPALERVALYGEWRGILSHARLLSAWQSLRDRRVSIELL